jgi:hypothetical protein
MHAKKKRAHWLSKKRSRIDPLYSTLEDMLGINE